MARADPPLRSKPSKPWRRRALERAVRRRKPAPHTAAPTLWRPLKGDVLIASASNNDHMVMKQGQTVADKDPTLEVLQAQVEVLGIVVRELCRVLPAQAAGLAFNEVQRRVSVLADSTVKNEAQEADEHRAAMTARVLSALDFAARGS